MVRKLALFLLAVPLAANANAREIAGHYYLSSVRETGSELLLSANGRYRWYISYGAVDRASEGTWRRQGDVATLISDKPKSNTLFTLDERESWTERAEQVLLDRADRQAQADALARCPFKQSDDIAMTYPPPGAVLEPVPAALQKAQESLGQLDRARVKAELAAEKAVAGSAIDMATAEKAFDNWRAAKMIAIKAYDDAGVPMPRITEPKLPAVCLAPEEVRASDVPPERWQRGAAVVVGDPAIEMRYSGISVRFTHSDGYQVADITNRGGWAIAPQRGGAKVIRISVSLSGDSPRTATFDIPPLMNAIQAVRLNTNAVRGAPFETMTLKIDGDDLVPTNGFRGRYTR